MSPALLLGGFVKTAGFDFHERGFVARLLGAESGELLHAGRAGQEAFHILAGG